MSETYLKDYADSGLYVMQGRLSAPEDGRFQSFPRSCWQTEIERAPQIPLQGIEWIYDLYGEGVNPLETAVRRADLRARLAHAGISVVSVCADYFMDCPLVRIDDSVREQRLQKLEWLISVCPEMSVTRIVLPFVDASKIEDEKDAADVLSVLRRVLPAAQAAAVELHLETDMNPLRFAEFLSRIRHPLIKVNYDSGNSGSLGYRPQEEFAAYGERIGSFHIKDRVLGGSTVPLGTGDVDFAALRTALLEIDYRGDFVMQVARGEPGDEVKWLQQAAAASCSWLRGENNLN